MFPFLYQELFPLQTRTVDLGGWLTMLALLLGPGVVAAVLWAPFLVAGRIRALFRALPPWNGVALPYALVTVGASLPYVVGTLAAITVGADGATGPGSGAAMANALLNVIVPLSVGYVVGVPVLGAVVLPHVGVDWDPTGYGPGTWLLLFGGGAWYAAVFAVPLFVVAVVLAFPA